MSLSLDLCEYRNSPSCPRQLQSSAEVGFPLTLPLPNRYAFSISPHYARKRADSMDVVILCGGQGTRIRDVADHIPKPMVPIGGRPWQFRAELGTMRQ